MDEWKRVLVNGTITVEFTETVGYEPDKGMRAELKEIKEEGLYYVFTLNISRYKEYNKNFEQPIWFNEQDEPTLRWSETPFYPHDNDFQIEILKGSNVPFKIVRNTHPFVEYENDQTKLSYLEWLEKEYITSKTRI